MIETTHVTHAAESEYRRHLVAWADAALPSSSLTLIHQLIEAQAQRCPGALALISPHTHVQLTYQDLNQQANQLAHVLRKKGVGPEIPVCVCLERSPELLIAFLAIMKAGGVYVPLEPTYPAARLVGIVQELAPPVLVTEISLHPLFAALPEDAVERLCFERDRSQFEAESTENLENLVVPENLVYMIYTSGSTGVPKGVQISHRNLLNTILWKQRTFAQTAQDRESCLAGVAFDAAQWEIWATLIAGGSICLPEAQVRVSAEALQTWILAQHITICTVPTQLAESLLKLPWPASCSLRYLITGGDRLHLFAPAHVPFTLINGYGPTENTIVSTLCAVPVSSGEKSTQMPSIGTALTNVETYILDEHYQPVALGQEGELYLGGVGLARGYFRRPDWTAERFLPHPFATYPGARLYATGDICSFAPDGQIEFIGRRDQQLKIRGFRIELGDIETALSQHPAVKESAVSVYRKDADNLYLVAYLVAQEAQSLVWEEIRTFLLTLLPDYMLPTFFVALDALPMTPSGKVDRQALPEPSFAARENDADFVGPRTETEQILAEICCDVLRLDQISVHDNMFLLGAYSLLTTLILSRVRAAFQVVLPFAAVFQAPSVAQLAQLIEREQAIQGNLPEQVLAITPAKRDQPIPLSFSQERVWFMTYLDPKNAAYHFQATIRLKGDVHVEAVEMALNEIVRRHEVFRTTVQEIDGNAMQKIHPATYFPLPLVDLRAWPSQDKEAQVQKLVREESVRLFDLSQLPLVRWTLVRIEEQDYELIHVEHHLVHDGWSLNVFLREFIALYRAFAAGQPSPLPEPSIQFADFVAWHRQWMQSGVQEQQLRYWQQKLQGAPTFLALPTDYPRPSVQRFKGSAIRVALPKQLYLDLRDISKRENTTLYTVMLAAFSMLMARYANQDDFCLGSAIANRRWKETEDLLGMLVNNIVLRIQLGEVSTLRDLLRQLRTLTAEAYENQDIPFDQIVNALHIERDMSHNPLFQIMFSFHDSAAPQLELPGLEVKLLEGINNGSAKFDMNVTVAPRFVQINGQQEPTGFLLHWEYNTDLFARETIERMLNHFQLLLQTIIAEPDRRLDEISLLSATEYQEIVEGWNETAATYPVQCIHELIHEQALLHPTATALIFEGQCLTYRELDQRSNQLARYLQQCGVGPDTLVGVCMDRSLELGVALVGILKAGGAYVPLDPSYPVDRLAYMQEDAGVQVLLTQTHLLTRLPKSAVHTICLDQDWLMLAASSTEPVASSVVPANLAYMIYTSGSTGHPKGAMNTHEALCNRLTWMQETYRLTPADRVLQKTPISFDVSVWELFWPLITGATLVMARPGGHQDSGYLARLISEQKITTMHFVPSMLAVFLQEPLLEQCKHLTRVMCSGEALPYHLQQEFFARISANLYNLYGPTEAAIDVTHWTCQATSASSCVPIGVPIANIQIYLLDRHLRPVPIGVAGELYIGGIGLSRGYYQRPELTAERFIPNPFSSTGGRLYRSGDLARFLPDGSIEFLGRIDHQIKLRGFRIELGEIEATLREHPDVSEAVVIMQANAVGEKHLVAYVVAEREEPLEIDHLQRHLQKRLPYYMVPSFFLQLEALPLTPNGKLDRRALPALATQQRASADVPLVSPTGAIECALADLWCQVLGVEQVSMHDNFFHQGGQSLSATRLLSRLRQTFQVEVPLRLFFDRPTLAQLAAEVTQSLALQTNGDTWAPTDTAGAKSEVDTRNYQQLLDSLDGLSDEEVATLLKDLADESVVSQ